VFRDLTEYLCQIWRKSFQYRPSYCGLTDFKMADAAMLNLLPVSIFTPRARRS